MKPQPATITSLDPPQATEIREKPDISEYEKEYEGIWLTQFYETALKDYQLSQVPMDIENAQKGTLMNTSGGEDWKGWFVDRGGWYVKLELNQPVQIVRTGDKICRIVKI